VLLRVSEIFYSIQGESTHAGLPCIFVRLTGCNLRCHWCDTEYAFQGGERMTLEAVEAEIQRHPCRRVEFTGGEPLLQAEGVAALARRLLDRGYTVMIETSGERDVAILPPAVIKIVDVKCPGSGEGGTFQMGNLRHLQPWDELKFVLRDRADYEFARDFVAEQRLDGASPAILFSPAFRKDAVGARSSEQCELDPARLAEWILADGLPVRLALQIHKFLWDPATRGV